MKALIYIADVRTRRCKSEVRNFVYHVAEVQNFKASEPDHEELGRDMADVLAKLRELRKAHHAATHVGSSSRKADRKRIHAFEVRDRVEKASKIGARCLLLDEARALGEQLGAAGVAVEFRDAMLEHRDDEIPTVPCVVMIDGDRREVHGVWSKDDLDPAKFLPKKGEA